MEQVKKPEGHERANLRWADVEGDGRADLLFTDNLNGDTFVWKNEGEVDERIAGSKFRWTFRGKLYAGQVRSGNQYYPDLDGDGRADLQVVSPDDNSAVAWFNICPNTGSGQDDFDMLDPKEPALPECRGPCVEFCSDENGDEDPDTRKRTLEKRNGKPRSFEIPDIGLLLYIISRSYPSIGTYLRRTPAGPSHVLYGPRGPACEDAEMQEITADDSNGNLQSPLPAPWQTNRDVDHPFDVSSKLVIVFGWSFHSLYL